MNDSWQCKFLAGCVRFNQVSKSAETVAKRSAWQQAFRPRKTARSGKVDSIIAPAACSLPRSGRRLDVRDPAGERVRVRGKPRKPKAKSVNSSPLSPALSPDGSVIGFRNAEFGREGAINRPNNGPQKINAEFGGRGWRVPTAQRHVPINSAVAAATSACRIKCSPTSTASTLASPNRTKSS